jgi:2-oxoisovalerate dehydrogenase E1 component
VKNYVYKHLFLKKLNLRTKKEKIRFIDAISTVCDNLWSGMTTNHGQDVAEYGGAFKITDGFVSQFGKNVINTRFESAVVSAGMGLSINGYKNCRNAVC